MAWLKVDDRFCLNSKAIKVWTTNPAALGLWLMGGSWTANQMEDGFIPSHVIAMLGSAELADVLMDAGLWSFDATRDGFLMNDFLKYNPSRAELEAKTEQKRVAGKAGGKQSASRRQANAKQKRSKREAESKPEAVPEPETETHTTALRAVVSASALQPEDV